MGVAIGDFDGNGFLDTAKTNFYGDLTSLYKNADGRFFTDVAREAGLGRRTLMGGGVAFGEPYLQPSLLFLNRAHGKFENAAASAGAAFQEVRPARGLAVGDLDGDGRPEIVIVNMNGTPSLLKNQRSGGSFLNVAVTGTNRTVAASGPGCW